MAKNYAARTSVKATVLNKEDSFGGGGEKEIAVAGVAGADVCEQPSLVSREMSHKKTLVGWVI